MEGDGAGSARGATGRHHQRQEMVLVRLRGRSARRVLPANLGTVTGALVDHCLSQPGIEGLGFQIGRTATEEAAHVVIALAADDAAADSSALMRFARPDDRASGKGVKCAHPPIAMRPARSGTDLNVGQYRAAVAGIVVPR